MNVVQMAVDIDLVPDYVIPKSGLPHSSFFETTPFSVVSGKRQLYPLHDH